MEDLSGPVPIDFTDPSAFGPDSFVGTVFTADPFKAILAARERPDGWPKTFDLFPRWDAFWNRFKR